MTADRVRVAVAAGDLLGETPLWCGETGALWWLDIDGAKVQRFTPSTGRHDAFAVPARFAGSLCLHAGGGLVVGLDLALHRFDPDSGRLAEICRVEPAGLDNRLNDGRCDGSGRLWVGTMDNQLHRPNGSFYRIDPDGRSTWQFGDVIVSNTVAIAPDQRRLYVSDTRRFTVWAFDLDAETGTIGNRQVFADMTCARDRPDGACVDSDGGVWIAIFAGGRIQRHLPDGRIDRVVPLPVTNPTCMCLGGDDLRTLYITSARKFLTDAQLASQPLAGAVLALDVAVPGLPEARYGRR